MALVMLPCDLPWWGSVQKQLKKISSTKNTLELIEGMQKIHELCSVSLDPDEDTVDPEQFVGLLNFLDNDLTSEERRNFLNKTLPNIVKRALNLKQWKPRDGLHFSLQQQPDSTELDYNFISSLIANAFFSTFPKRTDKSHPTLQNFNFSNFFKHLHTNIQKAKLRCILYYFDWLEIDDNSSGTLKILRQVMSSKEWLTIEDWLECSLPLCDFVIRHEGKLERTEPENLFICFSSSKIGGKVLGNGNSQECISLTTIPELLSVLLNVEALEDNEVVTVEGARRICRINDVKNRASLEKIDCPNEITLCWIDAEDYTKLPISQYEEDNILRELNKCLLGFQQKQSRNNVAQNFMMTNKQRRLSPIGESLSSTPPESSNIPLITQESCSTNRSRSESPKIDNNKLSTNKLRLKLEMERNMQDKGLTNREGVLNNRRGRFIVLGSSGECLPVTRKPVDESDSLYSSCESSEEEFHSAKTSVDDGSGDEDYNRRYSVDLETAERRNNFAQRLRDALRREASPSTSSDSSYAVGISVTGSEVADCNINVRRGGSTGFTLREETLDEDFLKDSLQQEKQWISKFKSKQSGLSRKESNRSSDYSFSTEYSSELEEVYEQFSRWLENPILETEKGTEKELDSRELAVVQFAGSLLKRALSESFAGVPLTEGCDNVSDSTEGSVANKKSKLILNAKSLSLELARHKHRLAAQLIKSTPLPRENSIPPLNKDDLPPKHSRDVVKNRNVWFVSYVTEIVQTLEDVSLNVTLPNNNQLSQIAQRPKNGIKAVATGNWGCGSSRAGEVQLKVMIQWLAASVAGVPALIYYTSGHKELGQLDTVYRILRDRKWSVKDLAQATLRYSFQIIRGREVKVTLFEEIIGVDKTA